MSRAAGSSDRYLEAVATGPGAALAKRLGLPRPVALRRGGGDLLPGPALVSAAGSGPGAPQDDLVDLLRSQGAEVVTALTDGARLGAVVLDARAVESVADLEEVRAALSPAVRALLPGGRVLVLAVPPGAEPVPGGGTGGAPSADAADGGEASRAGAVERAAARHALDGLVRSVAKELRGGATANMVRLPALRDNGNVLAAASSTLAFLLSGRSAYVDGQVVDVGPPPAHVPAWSAHAPLVGQVAVVTGAARGIGAAIATTLASAGAHVVGVDVPAAGQALAAVLNPLRGTALPLDITAPDAGRRLSQHLLERHDGAHVLVHNAGITRDRLLVNLDAERWGSVLAVNLTAQLSLTEAVLDAGALQPGGRVVAVSSTSGIAGNRGQTNYAASKAGVIGLVRALAPLVADRATVNAVAPGFIETELTARMPPLTRQVARRVASLAQGGLPVDVAETVAWLAEPASAAVTGQVVRVCGQNLVGA